jgi:hypothetical protein
MTGVIRRRNSSTASVEHVPHMLLQCSSTGWQPFVRKKKTLKLLFPSQFCMHATLF